jgi:hypothetical protein
MLIFPSAAICSAAEPDVTEALKRLADTVHAALAAVPARSPGLEDVARAAIRNLDAALCEAAGRADDHRWREALASVQAFVMRCEVALADGPAARSNALATLRSFVKENEDLAGG